MVITEEEVECYRKAGKIASQARGFGKKLIKPGVSYLEVVEKTEAKIKELGGETAFPTNLSVNEIGAHDTADIDDKRILKEGDLVKLDVGAQIDGYIADTAVAVSLGGNEDMIETTNQALKNALKMMVPGQKVSEVSEVIEKTIRENGFNPIVNLTGHGLDKFDLHAKMEFPNVKNDIKYELKEGDVFAIEPFATNGSGRVKEIDRVLIYRFMANYPTRLRESRKVLSLAQEKYHGLPFSRRWLTPGISKIKLMIILKQLTDNNALHQYPVLKEVANGIISQTEHTVIVKDKPEVTTL
jgi:methionyl aminopeptidase